MDNIILLSDSYKVSHHRQYPPGTTTVYSYFESRGGKFPTVVVFGLQYILKKYLTGAVVTKEKIDEARSYFSKHFSHDIFYEEGWRYILEHHGGHLPIRIKAVPEGTVIPTKNVIFTVENTDPKCYWLTSYLETILVQAWYPMTVATNSRYQKEIIAKYLRETADKMDGILFKLHDFGFRGSTSVEAAGIGGCAHLVNFRGTDTMAALVVARKYYDCEMAGFSIPAAEHSTITSWGREHEVDAFKNMLERFPNGLVAVVSDSYDVLHACNELWGEKLKSLVVKRGENGGTLVVRPDSGDPPKIVVQVLNALGEHFGHSTNSKGYKMLPSCVRVIQGDGISYESLSKILDAMKAALWSADNLGFGSGGALLQQLDRDTQKCAYKCSFAVINGAGVNVFKDPITDSGKKSKKGRLSLELRESGYATVQEGQGSPDKDVLVTVFENGKLLKEYTLDEIRKTAKLKDEP